MPKPAIAPRKNAEPKYARLTSEQRRAALIDAGLACMARGGIQEFTVDKICAEAGTSRGLITHHFGSINALLAAVYAKVYRDAMPDAKPDTPPELRIIQLINHSFDLKNFNREMLNVWIALWGQISNSEELGAEHRRQYQSYLQDMTKAIKDIAAQRSRIVAAQGLAKALICLIDGLGLQHCIDPIVMPVEDARAICFRFLEPHLGPIG